MRENSEISIAVERNAEFSRKAAKECSPQLALSEVEGAQAVGEKWNLSKPRRGERNVLTQSGELPFYTATVTDVSVRVTGR